MKFRTQHSPFPFISLLAAIFLLTAGPAFANPPDSMHGKSKGMHSSSGDYGKSQHEGFGDPNRSSHRDGMHKRHGGSRHSMHSSRSGMGHKKRHGDHGSGSMHERDHQAVMKFFKHILKNKDAMSLTDEQVQQLRDLKINYKKDRIRMKADVDIAEVDLYAMLRNENAKLADTKLADIEAQMKHSSRRNDKTQHGVDQGSRDALAVLSDEQQSRMDKVHERIKVPARQQGTSRRFSQGKEM